MRRAGSHLSIRQSVSSRVSKRAGLHSLFLIVNETHRIHESDGVFAPFFLNSISSAGLGSFFCVYGFSAFRILGRFAKFFDLAGEWDRAMGLVVVGWIVRS